jgi:hypothetical protein
MLRILNIWKRKPQFGNEINILRRICNEGVNVDFGNGTHVEVGQS